MKKKASHVGMIISFLIFITFIVFLYIILKPAVNTGQDKKTIVQYIEAKIIENTSSNLTSTSIAINSSAQTLDSNNKCILIHNFLILSQISPPFFIIKNETSDVQDSYTDYGIGGGDIMINRKTSNNLFFKIYSSDQFDLLGATSMTCYTVADINYSIGTIRIDDYAFEKKLYNLVNYYNARYDDLKRSWNIPSGNEFTFSFIQSNGTKISAEQNITSNEVYTDEIPVQYIDNEANIQGGFIDVKVW